MTKRKFQSIVKKKKKMKKKKRIKWKINLN
jgi:hypothetical protein